MKVYIGPPKYRWISRVHDRYMCKKYGYNDWPETQSRFENALEKLEDAFQWVYNHSINLLIDKKEDQVIKVQIHNYDIWSMDHTLAHIVVPMLKLLKEKKHGAPYTDDEDVPEELRSTSAPAKESEYDLDNNHYARWEYILDEMIWAFEQKARLDWEGDYYEFEESSKGFLGLKITKNDKEGRKAHQARMSNGFRLFGKYYEALWT